jgi:hypothetical protein
MHLTWNKVPDVYNEGGTLEYIVEMRETPSFGGSTWIEECVTRDTKCTISGLIKPGVEYEFKVSASTGSLCGALAWSDIAIALSNVPGVPDAPVIIDGGSCSVRITWAQPRSLSGSHAITSYEIRVKNGKISPSFDLLDPNICGKNIRRTDCTV